MVIIDGNEIYDIADFHRKIKAAFSFPEWYGGNLDALADCLTELPAGSLLVIRNAEQLWETLGEYGIRVRRVLADVEEEGRFTYYCE